MRLVFLRPRNAENLGAVARAMKNFGLEDWVVVSPNPLLLETPNARKLAVHAEALVEQVRVVSTLEEAVSDCSWVVGTTMRQRPGVRRLLPRELAEQAAERSSAGAVALVFGDERNGLTNDDLDRCHAVSFIPAAAAQPSLNLAPAALLYCYEWRRAVSGPRPTGERPREATQAQLAALQAALKAGLEANGFFRGGERHALRDLLGPLERARLTEAEAKLWNTALRVLAKADSGT